MAACDRFIGRIGHFVVSVSQPPGLCTHLD
jgi:hypothetical protein